MAAQPSSSAAQDEAVSTGRRAAARLRLAVPARFVSIYATQSCILMDISRTGARIALPTPLAEGKSGYIEIGRLEIFGMIVRTERRPDMAVNALAFDDPILHEDVLQIRRFAEGFELRNQQVLRDQVRRWVAGDS